MSFIFDMMFLHGGISGRQQRKNAPKPCASIAKAQHVSSSLIFRGREFNTVIQIEVADALLRAPVRSAHPPRHTRCGSRSSRQFD